MLQLTAWSRRVPGWVQKIWREVAAFGIVGALAFVVETASFNLLIFGSPSAGGGLLGDLPVLASVVATLLAMVVSWVGNKYWTYRDRRGAVDRREVTLFVAVNLAGMAVTAVPVYVSHELMGFTSPLSDNVARLVGWAAATVLRFVAYRSLVFTPSGEDSAHVPGTIEGWTAKLRAAKRSGSLWQWYLAAIAAFCAYVVTTIFHPGYLSVDSVSQLNQALGETPVTDWHPPVMALLWRILIDVTGAFSAMAALQATVLWVSLWLLARLTWKKTGSRGLSLAMLAVGLLPFVVNFTGVVWKDVHMAYALLAVLAIALTARELPADRTKARWVLLAVSVLLLAYTILVRKNAFPAVIPVFILLVLALWPAPGRRRWLVATGALIAVTVGANAGVNAATDPLATRQYAQIPLDDVVHVLPPDQLRAAAEKAGATPVFVKGLLSAAETCDKKNLASDAYFFCYPAGAGDPSSEENAAVLMRMWVDEMPKHWKNYTEYRIRLFAKQLFQVNYRVQDGTPVDKMSGEPAEVLNTLPSAQMKHTLTYYVTGFARDLPMLFSGWFWLAIALVLTLRRQWVGPYTRELRLLGLSTILYIAAYLPTAVQSNFRYVYWPALSLTVAVLLIVSSAVVRRRDEKAAAEVKGAPAAAEAVPTEATTPTAAPMAPQGFAAEAVLADTAQGRSSTQ
ncbi:GtrA family protein [Streptomyces sp. NPDC055103]